MLYHVYNTKEINPPTGGFTVAGHAYSPDGHAWTQSKIQPYNNTFATTDGARVSVATRERPKLLFNAAGEPTHLVNPVCSAPQCAPRAAIDCKNYFHDYTLVVPLAV